MSFLVHLFMSPSKLVGLTVTEAETTIRLRRVDWTIRQFMCMAVIRN